MGPFPVLAWCENNLKTMKLNVSFPATGCQKLFEIDDEKKVRVFYEKRMGAEVEADSIGDEWKGYVVRIAGGNDKQGFPMKQGVLTNNRVRLLLSKGHSCYRPRRTGERKRKSVRGCIVDSNLSVIALQIVKKGDGEIPGLTDSTVPRRLGAKRERSQKLRHQRFSGSSHQLSCSANATSWPLNVNVVRKIKLRNLNMPSY